jgi:isopenicillin N synthase-like dioxygenase
MNSWGDKMLNAVRAVAELAAIGFGLERNAFVSLMEHGPHLLAPTGSDLDKHRTEGEILAGFHYDLNFITIHGKSRFPGLFAWTRSGKRIPVRVPDGYLLCQAGKQFEILTGGNVIAGHHEVICSKVC